MKTTDKLKISVFEAVSEGLVDKELGENMLNFCESADLNNPEDLQMAMDIADTLMTVAESAEVPEIKDDNGDPAMESETPTRDEIALNIFESERSGEITAEEREILLDMLG